jgi:Carboxypeptidase regulatory-like domain
VKYLFRSFILLMLAISAFAADTHTGQIHFGEVPLPGAVVRAVQGERSVQTVSDLEGRYAFQDLGAGAWTIQVEMSGFETARREWMGGTDVAVVQWDLKMLPLADMKAKPSAGFPNTPPTATLQVSSPSDEAADRLLINGSVNNGASTPFALANAFGNNRRGGRSLYTGNLSVSGNNSVFDARPFSLTGQDTPQPAYNRVQTNITFGGPFQIPSVFRNGSFSVTYNRIQNRNAGLQTAQLPTAAQRNGDLSETASAILDPSTGLPFAGNVIPTGRISPQAKALVSLYPLPNFVGQARYNYQVSTLGVTHGDSVQGAINNFTINSSNRLSGTVAYQNSRSDNPDLFGFTDKVNSSSVIAGVTWNHRFTQRVSATIRYQFNRRVGETLPYFGRQLDISGDAGIMGNDRDPRNWGPPALNFSGGVARLSTGSFAFDRNNSSALSYSSTYNLRRHGFSYGGEFRWQQFNLLSQLNSRGAFTFTGAATGNDFADFLLSIPATSSLALGNADKYFRQSFPSAYLTDDWRVTAKLTLTLGARFEYESPITELYGRLVNLDIGPGFQSATPVVAGTHDNSLVRSDKRGIEPRLAVAWRPRATSSMIVRAGYGVYRDTNVYRAIADQMAQQSPLSKSLSVQNTPEHPITLADGFQGSPAVTATTFAIDPRFRVGTAQNWQLSIQQDLPQAMQMTVTYLGIKGTHIPQRTLPNTFPSGAPNPCAGCPVGFVYLTSGGNSSRHSGTVEVRRRQRNGLQASAQYTFAKAIDDAGFPGNSIAQNWLDLRAERALSNFDQRHLLVAQAQYTTGMRTSTGGFWDGWRGTLFRQWTVTGNLTMGSGTPLTPVILAPVNGTGVTGSLRPNLTGVPLYIDGALNPLAYEAPAPGEWGSAGRNTITGPTQFLFNASLTRTFRVNERVSLDLRIDSTNVLNHVTFPSWNTTVNNSQFGLPASANQMRTLQPSLRMRF